MPGVYATGSVVALAEASAMFLVASLPAFLRLANSFVASSPAYQRFVAACVSFYKVVISARFLLVYVAPLNVSLALSHGKPADVHSCHN